MKGEEGILSRLGLNFLFDNVTRPHDWKEGIVGLNQLGSQVKLPALILALFARDTPRVTFVTGTGRHA